MADISGLPPELQVDAQSLARRQALAELLARQSMQPIEMQQHGRIASRMSPLQPLAQMFSAYAGHKMGEQNAAAGAKLGSRYENFLQQGVQDYMRQKQGTGVAPDPQEIQQSQDQGTPAPAGAGPAANPRALATMAMLSRNPAVQALGKLDYEHEQKLDLPHNTPPGTTTTTGRGTPLVTAAPLHQIPADWKKFLPADAVTDPRDGPGIYRMKGSDGVMDPFQIEFEGGQPKTHKRLDNASNPNAGANRVQQGTVQDPLDPTKTLLVNTNLYNEDKYRLSGGKDRTGVIGAGPKPSTEGVARTEGFATFQAVNSNLDKLEKQLDITSKANLGRITGLPGAAPNVPGMAGADAQARLESLKSMIGFDVLQTLRAAAHNGASGLGQVTEKEHVYLQNQLGALEKATSEKEMRRVIGEIQTWVKGARERYKQSYDTRFGGGHPPAAGGATPPPDGFKPL